MKLHEFERITRKDNEVCYGIENVLAGNNYNNISVLLQDALDVIVAYRSLIVPIVDDIEIEKILKG